MCHSLDAHSDPQESYVWYPGKPGRKQCQTARSVSMMPNCAIMGVSCHTECIFNRNFPFLKWIYPKYQLWPHISSFPMSISICLRDDLAQRYLFWLNFLKCLRSIKLGALDFRRERHFLSFVVQLTLGQGQFLYVSIRLSLRSLLSSPC